jgi:hypothetical protein
MLGIMSAMLEEIDLLITEMGSKIKTHSQGGLTPKKWTGENYSSAR